MEARTDLLDGQAKVETHEQVVDDKMNCDFVPMVNLLSNGNMFAV